MKRLLMIVLIAAGIVSLFLRELIIYHVLLPDWSQNRYMVRRLSPESNVRGSDENYFFLEGDLENFRWFSFEAGEAADKSIEVAEGKSIESAEAVDNCIYYTLSDGTVRRFHCETQTQEEIFSREDILRMYGREDIPESARISITRSEECLFLLLDGADVQERIYVCTVDEDLQTGCVEVNDLFPKEDRTGMEQEIVYRGLRIKRYYDAEKERYEVIALVEMESGWSLFDLRKGCSTIKAAEKLISFERGRYARNCSYWVEGNLKEHNINCLYGGEYSHSAIQENKLTTEDGDIIGLVHVVKNFRCESYDPWQNDLKYDVLFKLDPETGEDSILYQARNNRTRVIGYQDGVIYLMKNYRIYTQTVGSRRKELFLKLPRDRDYTFDWQEDYLIVIRGSEIYGAYKIQ